MSGSATRRSSPTSGTDRRAGAGIAILVALGWAASVVAANGLVSLAAGLEVVPVAGAGPLAEPAAVALATVLIGLRSGFATTRSVLLPVETALLSAVLLILVPSAVALVTGPAAAFLTLGRAATSVFTVVDVVLAAVAGLIVLLVVRARAAGAGTPRWPWEDGDRP
jgi:hypothetical protein